MSDVTSGISSYENSTSTATVNWQGTIVLSVAVLKMEAIKLSRTLIPNNNNNVRYLYIHLH